MVKGLDGNEEGRVESEDREGEWEERADCVSRECESVRPLPYQFVAAKPPSSVGANTDGVLSRVVWCEREPTFGRVVARQHHLAKRVLYLLG